MILNPGETDKELDRQKAKQSLVIAAKALAQIVGYGEIKLTVKDGAIVMIHEVIMTKY